MANSLPATLNTECSGPKGNSSTAPGWRRHQARRSRASMSEQLADLADDSAAKGDFDEDAGGPDDHAGRGDADVLEQDAERQHHDAEGREGVQPAEGRGEERRDAADDH